MSVLRGKGFGTGATVARAALVGDDRGRPTLDADLMANAALNLRKGMDSLDIVLVAEDAARALLIPLPEGLTLVGVIGEREANYLNHASLPVVCGVTGARDAITEGTLLILDAGRGRITLDPTAQDIARLQTEPNRPRYRLGAAHTPARTQSGREVSVWAAVQNISDVEMAGESGADGLFITPGGDLLPKTDAPESLLPSLLQLADDWGSGDIALASIGDTLDPALLCELATRCRLRWVLTPEELPLPLRDLRNELLEIVREEAEEDRTAQPPRLALHGDPLPLPDLAPDPAAWDELFIPLESAAALTPLDTLSLPPILVFIEDGLTGLPEILTLGVSGVVVNALYVSAVKEEIRGFE